MALALQKHLPGQTIGPQSSLCSPNKGLLLRPQKYVEEWPFRLFLLGLGYFFTYFWGPGYKRILHYGPLLGT